MSPIRSGAWLDDQVFPDPTWCVPGIIPEGCCLLAGHPKIGKSFLVLAIALAGASGGEVLGVQVEQRPVLYLALEDRARRLQRRGRMLLDDTPLPEQFFYLTREDPGNPMELAREWVATHRFRKPMVIVDTLEKIRGPRGHNLYSDDYQAGTLLQEVQADGGTVIAVHHSRKSGSDDFLDEVSGTLGLAGSVDTVITLKRQRNGGDGLLSVTGRDVDEMVYKVIFADGKWKADGNDLSDAARKVSEEKLSDAMRSVLQLVNARRSTIAADVVDELGLKEDTSRQYLRRLAGRGLIERIGTGAYGPVTVSQVSRGQDRRVSADEEPADLGDSDDVGGVVDPSQDELVLSGA
jgi:hypothetical protein